MAGRPRTTAKRLAEIEERVYHTAHRTLEKLRPKQYAARQYEDEETQDELCLCWNVAVEEAKEAWWYLEELLQLLEAAGGIAVTVLGSSEGQGVAERGGRGRGGWNGGRQKGRDLTSRRAILRFSSARVRERASLPRIDRSIVGSPALAAVAGISNRIPRGIVGGTPDISLRGGQQRSVKMGKQPIAAWLCRCPSSQLS